MVEKENKTNEMCYAHISTPSDECNHYVQKTCPIKINLIIRKNFNMYICIYQIIK